ncbi:hypothetical protein ACOSP7_012981 [Xanthoceras sorbifolium]
MPSRPFVIFVLGRLCSAHALFWCSSVRPIWESTVFWDVLNLQRHISCFDLLLWDTQKVFGSPSQPPKQPCSASWSPPPAGSLKLNTDTAVKSGFSVMGSGAVVRDSQGKVIAASAKPLLGFFPAELGELLALREGLLVAKELSLIIKWVELDAANAVCSTPRPDPAGPTRGALPGLSHLFKTSFFIFKSL